MNIVTGYTGVKHVTAGNEACQNMGTIGSGDYVLDVGNKLSASIISNNQIRVSDGDIFMQGRHATILAGTYDDVEIANGAQGLKRNDIIVARYTMNSDTSVENVSLVVKQGVAGEAAQDPEVETGDIRAGDALHEMALYRVKLDGLTVTGLDTLFSVMPTLNGIKEALYVDKIQVVTALPGSPDANTLYFVEDT